MQVDIDEMLSGSASDKAPSFNIEGYKQHLTSEEHKTAQIKALAENHRDQRILRQRQMNILMAMADPEKRDKLFKAVSTVHLNLLEEQDANLEVDAVIQHSFDTPEDLAFLLANKHSKFYRSTEVLDLHNEHPVQKQMLKGKYVGRRLIKKQKTPMQHFSTLAEAKSKMTKDQRLDALEKSMEDQQRMLTLLANNQIELANQLGETQKSLFDLQQTVTDLRKLKLYVILCNSKKRQTNYQLAKALDVGERTINRWKKELKQEGYL